MSKTWSVRLLGVHIRWSDSHAPSGLQVDVVSQHLSFHAGRFSDGIIAAWFSPAPRQVPTRPVAGGGCRPPAVLCCFTSFLSFVCQIRKKNLQCKVPTASDYFLIIYFRLNLSG